jgi:hypothetical protein
MIPVDGIEIGFLVISSSTKIFTMIASKAGIGEIMIRSRGYRNARFEQRTKSLRSSVKWQFQKSSIDNPEEPHNVFQILRQTILFPSLMLLL